jgi:hypothetical protein
MYALCERDRQIGSHPHREEAWETALIESLVTNVPVVLRGVSERWLVTGALFRDSRSAIC